jgi:hypothetical protein
MKLVELMPLRGVVIDPKYRYNVLGMKESTYGCSYGMLGFHVTVLEACMPLY